MCVYGGGRVVEALLLYFKFSQSSHAVIFCTAVFVLPVSSHVVISGAFQGPPLKVRRAHNTTSSGHASSCSATPTPTRPRVPRLPNRPLVSRANQATETVSLHSESTSLQRHPPTPSLRAGWVGSAFGGVGAEVGRRR